MNTSTLKLIAGVTLLTMTMVLPTTANTERMAPTQVDGISAATPVETPVKKKDKTKKQKQKRKGKKQQSVVGLQ